MPSPTKFRLVTSDQLGLLLKSGRKQSAMTQTDVARRVGLSQNRISFLESNADAISVKQLLAWCAALGLELTLGEKEADSTDQANW